MATAPIILFTGKNYDPGTQICLYCPLNDPKICDSSLDTGFLKLLRKRKSPPLCLYDWVLWKLKYVTRVQALGAGDNAATVMLKTGRGIEAFKRVINHLAVDQEFAVLMNKAEKEREVA